MLDLALKRAQELPGLAENGQVEVVVVVSDGDLPIGGQTNSNGKIGHTLPTDLAEIIALVVEHFNAMGPVVAYEDLHLVVHHNAVGEFQIARATELVENVAHHVEYHHPHNLAFDDDDPPPAVCGDSPRMLEDVGPKLPDEVAELGENLYLR